ncbi:MAG TPA: NmrA family NAD(P)-binding protein [Chthoniobacterales bacterium]
MKILVTGSTGKVGSQVLRELRKRNADVRVLVRKEPGLLDGIEVAMGDLLDPVSVEEALVGVSKLYLLNAVVPDELTQGLIAYGLAKKHRLQHVVYHSVFRADDFLEVPHFASKAAIENALKASDLPYTIIRPNYFHQNDESLKPVLLGLGVYPMPLGTSGVSSVDVRDIAEAAAAILTGEGHFGKTYNLNGPEPLTGPKAASIWSKLLGKPITYGGHDLEAFEKQMRQHAPSWSAFDVRMMFQGYLERGFLAQNGDLQTLTALLGHPPRCYEDFARETTLAWQTQEQREGKSR